MSATPNRVERKGGLAPSGPPLEEGNRVLESIGRQESIRALLAFSDLHEQIRSRRSPTGEASDLDLFQTERFVLDEVLQLVCNRTQALTHADAVILALAEGSLCEGSPGERAPEGSSHVCRAAAGPLSFAPGLRLSPGSQLLRECLESGKIVRCDDFATDARADFDLARQLGTHATVLVPLRGRRVHLGVLQAFSTTPWAFTDQHIRCLDLFAELVLAALRPEDQDRRFHWLSDVAEDVLQARRTESPTPSAPVISGSSPEPIRVEAVLAELACIEPVPTEAAKADAAGSEYPTVEPASHREGSHVPARQPDEPKVPDFALVASRRGSLSFSFSSRPGLSVVLGLMAIAALFSAGVWWGMRVHGKDPATRAVEAKTLDIKPGENKTAATGNAATTTPSATSSAPDNLMDPAQMPMQSAVLVPVPESKLAALPKITGVRHWSSSAGTTVVIDMQDQVPYEVHRLVSPARIYFDLHDTVLAQELAGKTMEVGDASLARVRVAQPVAGVTRVVLDTEDGSNFSVSMESNPYRLVVELSDSEKSAALNPLAPATSEAMKLAPASSFTASNSAPPLPAKTGKFRIVLDAGHGGWDLGTVGRQGLLEKDLVLDVTQRLRKLLQARLGSEVMLTRSGDEYLPLDQRADFANQAQADLFVSIHANYSSSATARGVETYYTNFFSAPGSREAEKRSDGTFSQPTTVSLSAGALHEKIEESRRLAASVQRSLYATLAAKSPDIRDRGIKDSAFAVLTGTTMPSILTEISFVSSPADEHNLQSEAYRQQIAEALYKGIARYQESSPRTKVAQLQTGTARR
ncbi:MAG: N-acetylmuramoyl-L-alanine amidase [Terriglobales bacterium]